MATIALYAGKINQMPGMVRGVKSAVGGLNTQLGILKRKCERVNANVCNIDDIIRSVSASTRTQEEKADMLETFGENVEQFVEDTIQTDENVAELVNKSKDDFYDKYSYLKPDSEKSWFEKAKEGLKKALEWCKEHWKLIATIVLVALAIGAIVLVAGGILAGAIGAALLKGAIGLLIGTVVGAISGGLIGALTRNKDEEGFWEAFWEGAEDGAFDGAVSGFIAGLLGGAGFLSSLNNAGKVIIAAIADGISSLIGNLGDVAAGLENMSALDVIANLVFSMTLGALGEGLTGVLDRFLKIEIKGINLNIGKGSLDLEWKLDLDELINKKISIDIDDIWDGIKVEFVDGAWGSSTEFIKKLLDELNKYIGGGLGGMQASQSPAVS